jgi:lipoprotein signal peptidase
LLDWLREHLYGFLMLATVSLYAAAGIAFSLASSGKDYLLGIGLLVCGALMFQGARKLKPWEADADMKAVSGAAKKMR